MIELQTIVPVCKDATYFGRLQNCESETNRVDVRDGICGKNKQAGEELSCGYDKSNTDESLSSVEMGSRMAKEELDMLIKIQDLSDGPSRAGTNPHPRDANKTRSGESRLLYSAR